MNQVKSQKFKACLAGRRVKSCGLKFKNGRKIFLSGKFFAPDFFVILLFSYFVILLFVIYNFSFAISPAPGSQTTNDFSYPIDPWQPCEESKFGTKRAKNTYHLGDDVLVPAGTPVKTMTNGIIKHIGIHSRFGTVVLIEHELTKTGEKFVSLYGHLRRKDIPISEDQFVNKGEVIGYVGAAGKENGYWPQEHLHFGIRWGEYVDVKTKWVYWGYSTKKDMDANWRDPTEFINGKGLVAIDPQNLTKIITVPANNGRAHIKMFDAKGAKIANSDIYAARFSSYPGTDVAVARTDTVGGRAIVVALGKHVRPYIKIYNKSDKSLITKFLAFPKKYKKGMRVATGDINGDGIDEIIVGSGGRIRPQFKIFDLAGNALRQVTVTKGDSHRKVASPLDIAASDIDGDKIDEIIVGFGSGQKPYVKIFKADGTLLKTFLAYNKNFKGGVRVSAADIDPVRNIPRSLPKLGKNINNSCGLILCPPQVSNGVDRDGIKEIVTGAGPGGTPHVRIFEPDGRARPINFFPFDPSFRGGVDVASADFNNDSKDEIIVSQNSSGQTWIKAYRYNSARTVLTEFLAYEAGFEGGANVAGMK